MLKLYSFANFAYKLQNGDANFFYYNYSLIIITLQCEKAIKTYLKVSLQLLLSSVMFI